MNKMKVIVIVMISTLLVLLILIFGCYAYIKSQKPCGKILPVPIPANLSIGPYYVNTDQGRLYPGQKYEHRNEGPWVGNLRLITVSRKGAFFLIRFPSPSSENIEMCIGTIKTLPTNP
jgi:hypothetical protein